MSAPGLRTQGARPQAQPKPTNDDCLACHNDASMVNGKEVHGDAFKASIHGSMFSCVDCHTDVKSIPHDAGLAKPKCITCHADEQKLYDNGIHGKALAAGQCESRTMRKLPRQYS